MAKISAAKAAAMFEGIIGWPYHLGGDGSNSRHEIDCSGAWVRVYKAHGKSIYHGSNAQYRYHCSGNGPITGVQMLDVGMAVFKCKAWTDADRGHRDYGKSPGNLYHVGCVTGINPLRIVHSTTPVAKLDTTLGKWTYWGRLTEVDLSADASDDHGNKPVHYLAEVVTQSGPLNLRASAPSGAVIAQIPRGDIVQVLASSAPAGWVLARHANLTGYVSLQYIQKVEAPSEDEQPGVFIPCESDEEAEALAVAMRELSPALVNATVASVRIG